MAQWGLTFSFPVLVASLFFNAACAPNSIWLLGRDVKPHTHHRIEITVLWKGRNKPWQDQQTSHGPRKDKTHGETKQASLKKSTCKGGKEQAALSAAQQASHTGSAGLEMTRDELSFRKRYPTPTLHTSMDFIKMRSTLFLCHPGWRQTKAPA